MMRYGDALLLAAGELRRVFADLIQDFHSFEESTCCGLSHGS
jgi:hypothetical protein